MDIYKNSLITFVQWIIQIICYNQMKLVNNFTLHDFTDYLRV